MFKKVLTKIKGSLIIGLGLALVLFLINLPQTFAYFVDSENSNLNTFSAGTLDFSLSGGADFSPKITPTQNTLRTININNNGSLGFSYNIKSASISGDLCSSLNLSAKLNGTEKYNGTINGLNYSAGQFATVGGNWQFEIDLTSSDLSLQNKTCNFDFVFDGLQIGGPGFSDSETISNSVTSAYWSVVLNEILANPFGLDDASMPGGEWVELYNNSSTAFDVNGWVIYDSDDSHELYITNANTNTGSTIVPGNGFLVVYRNGDSDFTINNNNETIRLYNGYPVSSSLLIDSYSWTVEKSEGLSYARIPDGTGAWVDPIPTPGSPNTLECAEQSFDSALPELPELAGVVTLEQPQEEAAPVENEKQTLENLTEQEEVVEPEEIVESENNEVIPSTDAGSAETAVQPDNTTVNITAE